MKEYFVLAVVLVIFIGLWLYLWSLDLRVKKLLEEVKAEHDEN